MPHIQQVDKAVPNSQQVCQAAEEQFHRVSRYAQQEGDAQALRALDRAAEGQCPCAIRSKGQ